MRQICRFFLILICFFSIVPVQCMNPDVMLGDFTQEAADQMPKTEDTDFENARQKAALYHGKIIYHKGKAVGIIFITGNLEGGSSDLKIHIHPDYRGQKLAATSEALFIRENPGVGIGIARGNVASLKTLIQAMKIGNIIATDQINGSQITVDDLESLSKTFNRESTAYEDERFAFGVFVTVREAPVKITETPCKSLLQRTACIAR